VEMKTAQGLAELAVRESARFGKPVCVAICDERGLLLCFLRMDAAPVRSVELSQAKAYSAARLGITTAEFHARLQRDSLPASYWADPKLTGLAGGAVLARGAGGTLGAIGISGLLPREDQELADLVAASLT